MIQRAQTVYYAFAILALALSMAGMEIFSFTNTELVISTSLFGNEKLLVADTLTRPVSVPQLSLFWGNLLLILLLLITIFSYKKLKRQAAIGRFTLIVYLLFIGALCLSAYFMSQWVGAFGMSPGIGIGFYFILAGLLFVWLGNRGVKKDLKLLDSLNRLR